MTNSILNPLRTSKHSKLSIESKNAFSKFIIDYNFDIVNLLVYAFLFFLAGYSRELKQFIVYNILYNKTLIKIVDSIFLKEYNGFASIQAMQIYMR